MLIAICDDEQVYIDHILQSIKIWKSLNKMDDTIAHVYHSAEELIIGKMNMEDYNLFFLDLVLPGVNGVDLAKIIRKNNPFCTIVFTTNYDEYLEVGYEIPINRYLRKPLTEEKILACLDYAYYQSVHTEKALLLRVDGESRRIPINSVKYMSSGIHSVCIHTTTSSINASLRLSFDGFYEQMNNPLFLRCHRGYIVNMLYVDRFTSTSIYLIGENISIPIGRKYHETTITNLKAFFTNDFT